MSHANGEAAALHIATYSGWYRFEQSGERWQQTHKALTFWKMTSLQVAPDNARRVYVATEHSGLFVTDDGGSQWRRAKPNVPRLTTNALLALPGSIFAGTWPAALYRADNGGGWQELPGVRLGATGGTFPPSPELSARVRYLAADHETPRRLFAAIEVGGLLISDDDGQSWAQVTGGLDDPDVHQIMASERHKGVVIAVCGEGIYRSSDRGEHWQKITPAGARAFGSSVSEDGGGAIYFAIALDRPNTWLRDTGADTALYVSDDGGIEWRPALAEVDGGIMAMCAGLDGKGVFASTSEGDVFAVDGSRSEKIISGLPAITAISFGA